MLTAEYVRSRLSYNPENGELRWWSKEVVTPHDKGFNTKYAGKIAGYMVSRGYLGAQIDGKPYLLHRLAWLITHGSWPDDGIDHINGDPSDNRLANLRDVDSTANNRNKILPNTNKSGVMGVNWEKKYTKWRAQIQVDGKGLHLGYFTNKEDAISARKEADIKYGFHKNHGRTTTKEARQ
jgi:hypothetical protein